MSDDRPRLDLDVDLDPDQTADDVADDGVREQRSAQDYLRDRPPHHGEP